MQSKIKFEVVGPSVKGYQFLWENRRVILPYATLPFFVKIGCYAAVMLMGMEENYLRQGLVMLPSYFAEGFMVALMIRMAVGLVPLRAGLLAEEGVKGLDRNSLLAATIIYVLTQLFFSYMMGMVSLGEQGQSGSMVPGGGEGSGGLALLSSVAMFVMTLWAVRLAWLYVPVAMGYSVERFLRALSPFMVSVYMIGIMLICTVPPGVALLFVMQVGEMAIPAFSAFSFVVEAFAQIVLAIISSVAMALAVAPFLSGERAR